MAYIGQEKKKELAPRVKHILKKHGMKGTLSIDNYSTIRLTLQSGSIDFGFTGITTNPSGTKLINLGANFNAGLSDSEINKGSGEIVYLDNRPLIARNERQKEDIKSSWNSKVKCHRRLT